MKRTVLLGGLLIACVTISWIASFYFFGRLPERMPLSFGAKPYASSGPKVFIFLFPVVISSVSLLILVFYRFRRRMVFPGKRRLPGLPEAYRELIYQRAYQIVIMVGVFIFLFLSYIQLSLALYSLHIINRLQTWPLIAAGTIFVLYIIFNLLMLKRMVRYAEYAAEEQEEEDGKAGS